MVQRNIKNGRIHSTKTDKPRKIDLSDALISELSAMKKRRLAYYLNQGKNEIPEWVFCNSGGGFLDMQNVKNRYFIKCLQAAQLRRIRFHDLCHTFASLLIQNGESLTYVKEQMGHSSIKITCDVIGATLFPVQTVKRSIGFRSQNPQPSCNQTKNRKRRLCEPPFAIMQSVDCP